MAREPERRRGLIRLLTSGRRGAWRRLAEEMGGTFVEGGFLRSDAVQLRTENGLVTMDTYNGRDEGMWTRIRAPFHNPVALQFTLSRSSFFQELGKRWFGKQDLEVGHADFDRRFIVQGNRWSLIRGLLAIEEIRDLLMGQPDMYLSVRAPRSVFGSTYPGTVNELFYHTARVIDDVDRLKGLFRLFSLVLEQLVRRIRIFPDPVAYHVDRLEAPGGRVESGLVLWDGDAPRREAAARLAAYDDPRAVGALVAVLDDEDGMLRGAAAEALGTIGREEAAPPMVHLLGEPSTAEGSRVASQAREALRALGAGDVVEAFDGCLRGELEPAGSVDAAFWPGLVEALTRCTQRPVPEPIRIDAIRALGSLGAHTALPALRRRVRQVGGRGREGEALAEAITALEARASLPRPAAATQEEDGRTLPRPAEAGGAVDEGLPRPAGTPGEGEGAE